MKSGYVRSTIVSEIKTGSESLPSRFRITDVPKGIFWSPVDPRLVTSPYVSPSPRRGLDVLFGSRPQKRDFVGPKMDPSIRLTRAKSSGPPRRGQLRSGRDDGVSLVEY